MFSCVAGEFAPVFSTGCRQVAIGGATLCSKRFFDPFHVVQRTFDAGRDRAGHYGRIRGRFRFMRRSRISPAVGRFHCAAGALGHYDRRYKISILPLNMRRRPHISHRAQAGRAKRRACEVFRIRAANISHAAGVFHCAAGAPPCSKKRASGVPMLSE